MLLPWFETGKLEPADQRLVEAYLAAHPKMREQIARVAAEHEQAVQSNEAIAPPSAGLTARLMAQVDTIKARRSGLGPLHHYVQRAINWLGDRSALAPVAALAVLALLLQTGIIGTLLWQRSAAQAPKTFQTASVPSAAVAGNGDFVLAAFNPAATAGQIEQVLTPLGITIVDGPRAGGIYRLRLSEKSMGERDRELLITALKANSEVVRFVAPTTP